MPSPPPQSAQSLLLAGRYAEALSAYELALAARPGAAAKWIGQNARDLAGLFGPGPRSEQTAMLSTDTGRETVGS